MTRRCVLLAGLALLEAAVVAEAIPQSIDPWLYPSGVSLLTPQPGSEVFRLVPGDTGVGALLPQEGTGVANLFDSAPGIFNMFAHESGYGPSALASDWGISALIPAHSNLMPAGLVGGTDLLHSIFAPMQVYGVDYLFRGL